MAIDPTSVICEVLGEQSDRMRNPANQDYLCPYLEGECVKRSQQVSGPFPVCSVFKNKGNVPICVCPVRFNEISIIEDILNHCWPNPKPLSSDIRIVNQIRFGHLGTMDMVLVAVNSLGVIQKFISVELQAIDITGSYFPAYLALTNNKMLDQRPKYGFNWKNVYKRYVTQLINKGFQHHQWNTIIVSVMQDVVLDKILEIGNIVSAPIENSNVVFLGYSMQWNNSDSRYEMTLKKVIGTTHSNIVHGHLMKQSIPLDEITQKLQSRLLQA